MKLNLSDKKIKIILICGFIGIVLIFISSFVKIPNKESEELPKNEMVKQEIVTNEDYSAKLQEDISLLLKSVEGVGESKVMITLSSGYENVYVTEESLNSDKQGEGERRSSETKMLLVEDESGRRTALLKKTVEPEVRGVVVVCDGGDDPLIISRVTELLKAVLNINSTHICVTKLTKQ